MTNGLGVLAIALAIAAIAAGCGGGSDATGDPSTSEGSTAVIPPVKTSSISKAEYIPRANKVCDESWESMLESFASRYHSATKGKPFVEASENIFLPSMQFWFDDISYIGAPEGEKDQVENMLESLQLAVYKGEEQPVSSPKQLVAIFADFSHLAGQYGLDSCLVEESSFEA